MRGRDDSEDPIIPHALFPRGDDQGPETRKIFYLAITRRLPGQTDYERCSIQYKADELPNWQAITDLYGGGEYVVWASSSAYKFQGRTPPTFFNMPPKPLNAGGRLPGAPAPNPAPTPQAAAPPAFQAQGVDNTMILLELIKGNQAQQLEMMRQMGQRGGGGILETIQAIQAMQPKQIDPLALAKELVALRGGAGTQAAQAEASPLEGIAEKMLGSIAGQIANPGQGQSAATAAPKSDDVYVDAGILGAVKIPRERLQGILASQGMLGTGAFGAQQQMQHAVRSPETDKLRRDLEQTQGVLLQVVTQLQAMQTTMGNLVTVMASGVATPAPTPAVPPMVATPAPTPAVPPMVATPAPTPAVPPMVEPADKFPDDAPFWDGPAKEEHEPKDKVDQNGAREVLRQLESVDADDIAKMTNGLVTPDLFKELRGALKDLGGASA